MKKILICIVLCAVTLPTLAYAPPIAPVINVHDTQMIREQKFRREEINDYKEVQEEKERFEKRNRVETPVVEKRIINKEPELIDENGQIRIKY